MNLQNNGGTIVSLEPFGVPFGYPAQRVPGNGQKGTKMALSITDTDEVPSGRTVMHLAPELVAAVEDSARTGKAKQLVIKKDDVRGIRRQLGATSLRAKYMVNTGTRPGNNGTVRFIFKATQRTTAQ
jgi:hypothetical protein